MSLVAVLAACSDKDAELEPWPLLKSESSFERALFSESDTINCEMGGNSSPKQLRRMLLTFSFNYNMSPHVRC